MPLPSTSGLDGFACAVGDAVSAATGCGFSIVALQLSLRCGGTAMGVEEQESCGGQLSCAAAFACFDTRSPARSGVPMVCLEGMPAKPVDAGQDGARALLAAVMGTMRAGLSCQAPMSC